MQKLLIFFQKNGLKVNAGGPRGYLWHLYAGIKKLRIDEIPPDLRLSLIEPASGDGLSKRRENKPRKGMNNAKKLAHWLQSELYLLLKTPRRLNLHRFITTDEQIAEVLHGHSLVHAHSAFDALKILEARKQGWWQGKLILTSHSPEASSREALNRYRVKGFSKRYCNHFERLLLEKELQAFRDVDAWIFPSRHAMEPYLNNLPGFQSLAANKLIRFVPTGISPPTEPEQAAIKSRRLAPADAIQLCFVGRHNEVKGYDLLVDALLPVLEANPQVHMVCAGSGHLAAPSHPRWHALGQISDVQALLRASDGFILPNRQTYYDLVLIEALAAGLPIVATATGGNKDIATETRAVLLCDTQASAMGLVIQGLINLSIEERKALGLEAARCHRELHSETSFARNYLAAVHNIATTLETKGE